MFRQLTQFIPQIFAAGIVESLSYGNVDEVMALQSTDKVLSLMTDSLPRVDPATRQKIIKLQGEAIFQTRAYNSEPNSAFVAFFQVEKTTDRRNKVMSSLFGTFVREPFFDQLRTKETLGYTVSAWYHILRLVALPFLQLFDCLVWLLYSLGPRADWACLSLRFLFKAPKSLPTNRRCVSKLSSLRWELQMGKL